MSDKRRRVAYLAPEVDKRLRYLAVHEDRAVSDVIEAAVGVYILGKVKILKDRVSFPGRGEHAAAMDAED